MENITVSPLELAQQIIAGRRLQRTDDLDFLIRCDLDYVTGSNRVLENLVAGQWKTQFLVLEKGHTVKETDFFPAGEPGRRLLY